MGVSNQKPAVLSPVYDTVITGDFNPVTMVKQTMVSPLFTPLVSGSPVRITAQGSTLDEDDVTSLLMACLSDSVDVSAQKAMATLFGQTLAYFDAKYPLTIQDAFITQAAVKERMPAPSPSILYTPATDVIPACKEFLAGVCSVEKLFASFALYARPKTLGVYVANKQAFDEFVTWLSGEVAQLAPLLPAQTAQLFADFQKLNLDGLTQSLVVRNTDDDGNEECSFARTLVALIMQYTKHVDPSLYGILPFNVGELFCPQTLVLVNVERHALASARQVADEWKLITNSLQVRPKVMDLRSLQKLTGLTRAMRTMQHNAHYVANGGGAGQGDFRKSVDARFRKTPPTSIDMTRLVKRVMDRMTSVAKSENSFKAVKMTFARSNRRNPDDFNKQGKTVSTRYKPDIHVYIDTSGSICERNYQDAVKACIIMAKKLNVNLYFNSFSHYLSQCSHLRTKDKSLAQIYREFQRVPKVTGGTDFAQVWAYINNSATRRKQLSIMITDFCYDAPNYYVKHPSNLVYVPCSNVDWQATVAYAQYFVNSMRHIDPTCRRKVLC